MNRQPFSTFLQPAFTPDRGGRGGARGSPGGRGRGRGRGGAAVDYRAVRPVDYEKLNKERYSKMDGFNDPSTPGPSTPSSRGRPNKFPSSSSSSSVPFSPNPYTNSGTSTPTRFAPSFRGNSSPAVYGGLGSSFRGARGGAGFGGGFGAARGGRMGAVMSAGERAEMMRAPVFVKAGMLFPDGEVEIYTIGEDGKMKTEILPLSDPSAPQMTNLQDEIEVDVLMTSPASPRWDPEFYAAPEEGAEEQGGVEGTGGEEVEMGGETVLEVLQVEVPAEQEDGVKELEGLHLQTPAMETFEISESMEIDILESLPSHPVAEEEPPLFYIDTTPSLPPPDVPAYIPNLPTRASVSPRSSSSSEGEEEEMVYLPRFTRSQPVSPPSEPARTVMIREEEYISLSSFGAGRSDPKPTGRGKMSKSAKRARRRENNGKGKGKSHDPGEPRMGDSDIEWGSEDSEEDVMPQIGGSKGPARRSGGKRGKGSGKEDLALKDYFENLAQQDALDKEEEGSDDPVSRKVMERFAKVVEERNHTTLDDIEIEREGSDGEEWEDSSGSEIEEGGEGEIAFMGADEGEEVESEDGGDGDELDSEEEQEIHGVGWVAKSSEEDTDDSDEDSEDDDDDDDDEYGTWRGKSTKANGTEGFIQQMEKILDENAFMLGGKNSKEEKRMFKAIQNGDFGDDWETGPPKKGKGKAKFDPLLPKDLQAQWGKDRAKKADFKKQRAADRLEASLSLYPASLKYDKGKGKGKGKGKHDKGNSRESFKYQSDHPHPTSARAMAELYDRDSSDELAEQGLPRFRKLVKPVTDLASLNVEIQDFLRDKGKQAMTLPAMDKFSRKKVHEIAMVYGLKSLSKGKGTSRFPVLTKSSRSSLMLADERKIASIIGWGGGNASNGAFYKAKYGGGAGGGGAKRLPGAASRGGGEVRHRDGDAVGGGASKIGVDNIGHRLLSKMGWSEGDRIGLSGGIEDPIVAIVKNSKTGLGAY